MKIAKFSIYISFALFIMTIITSEVSAKESSSLRISGLIPHFFEVELQRKSHSFVVNSSTNFNFYGIIESDGLKIKQGEEVSINDNLKYKLVTVSIN